MSGAINKPERATQHRVIKMFTGSLGYHSLGNLEDKPDNSNIEKTLLRQYLFEQAYSSEQINKAVEKLQAAANNFTQDLQSKGSE